MKKIVAIVRTLNEERNIRRFCEGYSFCDEILVADGGSEDNTVEIAGQIPNVRVRHFKERLPTPENRDSWFNPEPRHINFLIEWAAERGADWIVMDDCDSVPNPALQRDAREIIETTERYAVSMHRIYLWKQGSYFPKMSQGHAQWAWYAKYINFKVPDHVHTLFDVVVPSVNNPQVLEMPPYVLVHDFCPDDETIAKKMERYRDWGHPQEVWLDSMYAPPEALPGWVFEDEHKTRVQPRE